VLESTPSATFKVKIQESSPTAATINAMKFNARDGRCCNYPSLSGKMVLNG